MRFLRLLIVIPFLVACTGAVNDFVEGGGGTTPSTPTPSVDLNGSGGFKLSPGHVTAVSGVANMRATITPTERQMTSSAGNAQMSLSASQTLNP